MGSAAMMLKIEMKIAIKMAMLIIMQVVGRSVTLVKIMIMCPGVFVCAGGKPPPLAALTLSSCVASH